MTAEEKQEHFIVAFAAQKGFNMRRAYVSTRCSIARERYIATREQSDYNEFEKYRQELNGVDDQAVSRYSLLRKMQTLYLVEYEAEARDVITERLQDTKYNEELYLFNDCDIDTYKNGWDIEDPAAQDLLYEVADFLLQYKSLRYTIKNIKRLQ